MMSSILKRFNKNKKRPPLDVCVSPSPLPSQLPSSSPSSSVDSFVERDSKNMEKVFRYIDEDGDGKISPAELRRCVKAVGAQRLSVEEAEAAVECSDSDGDGLLSLNDFERLMKGNGLSEEEKKDELREAFLMYNDNKKKKKKVSSGVITPKSLKRMLSRLGDHKSIHDCKDMIRVYDLNGDGVLSFDEFAIMMR
ncbi:calcium-binding protein CML39 [Beta vulgaris subsp. vulgaris]|uniref:calcium-binding protein CML39 n=1 Tax=Beta vulgaris subsp. vulgaris TaxID=3555 RepID=UPI002036A624|nr:calcium-binding protein CML39 [Beta vulgaris subsp. vulgaris]